MLSEDSLLTLGAVLGFQARAALGDRGNDELPQADVLPA